MTTTESDTENELEAIKEAYVGMRLFLGLLPPLAKQKISTEALVQIAIRFGALIVTTTDITIGELLDGILVAAEDDNFIQQAADIFDREALMPDQAVEPRPKDPPS